MKDDVVAQALISRADHFAEQAHAGQRRKYTLEPYIVHPRAVAKLVQGFGLGPEAIAAALLHDTLEDCPEVTVRQLRLLFGEEVAALVVELTHVTEVKDGNRAYRTEKNRQALANVSATAQNIKVADMIDNTYSIVARDKKFAKLYLQEARALLAVLSKADSVLVASADSILKAQEAKLAAGQN